MSSRTIHTLITSIALISALASCSKGAKEYSKEIAEGKTVYITRSQAGQNNPVALRPYKASLSMDKYKGDVCDLSVVYDFLVDQKHKSVSFRIPQVSVVRGEKSYSLVGGKQVGECTFSGQTQAFENVAVKGTIGFDGNASLELSGTMGEDPFALHVLESSIIEPAPQELVEVDYLQYKKISITNATSSACDVSFHFRDRQPVAVHLKSGETGTKEFWTDGEFWLEMADGCQELGIAIEGGKSATLTGQVVHGMTAGSQEGVLKCLDKETIWYLHVWEEWFEPASYLFERYEIVSQ